MGTSAEIIDSQIEEYVQQAVGSSSTSLVDDIVDKVKEIGIEKPSDFQYMDESDLDCLGLKKIQLRKLLKSWEEGKFLLVHHAVLIPAKSMTIKSQSISSKVISMGLLKIILHTCVTDIRETRM